MTYSKNEQYKHRLSIKIPPHASLLTLMLCCEH